MTKIFLNVDEAEIAKQKYISVLVGSLDAPNQTFLVDCHPLDSGSNVNSSIILHTVDDILRQLEIKRENFSLFLTDAARYMSLTGKTLKELYPSLMHVACVAHLLHNCTMRVHAHLKNIDKIIATIKAATIKNKDRKKDFHDAGLPSPPDPVITRWATWLRAALYSELGTANLNSIPQNCKRCSATANPQVCDRLAVTFCTSTNLNHIIYCYFVFVMTFSIFEDQILPSARR